jgi:hypothetical protein
MSQGIAHDYVVVKIGTIAGTSGHLIVYRKCRSRLLKDPRRIVSSPIIDLDDVELVLARQPLPFVLRC